MKAIEYVEANVSIREISPYPNHPGEIIILLEESQDIVGEGYGPPTLATILTVVAEIGDHFGRDRVRYEE